MHIYKYIHVYIYIYIYIYIYMHIVSRLFTGRTLLQYNSSGYAMVLLDHYAVCIKLLRNKVMHSIMQQTVSELYCMQIRILCTILFIILYSMLLQNVR